MENLIQFIQILIILFVLFCGFIILLAKWWDFCSRAFDGAMEYTMAIALPLAFLVALVMAIAT